MPGKKDDNESQQRGITDKQDASTGSDAFKQGSEPANKNTNAINRPLQSKKTDEDWGNVGKSNAGGNEQGSTKG